MKDLGSLMKQAQAMQEKLQEAQEKLAQSEVQGAAGAGMVRVTLSGTGEMKALALDPELIKDGDGEIVADLVIAAHADARRKLEASQAEVMQSIAGPLAGFPGMPKF